MLADVGVIDDGPLPEIGDASLFLLLQGILQIERRHFQLLEGGIHLVEFYPVVEFIHQVLYLVFGHFINQHFISLRVDICVQSLVNEIKLPDLMLFILVKFIADVQDRFYGFESIRNFWRHLFDVLRHLVVPI